MACAAAGIAHVMQAIEARHEVEVGFLDVLGARRNKLHPIAQSVRLRMASRLFHRRFVEVVSDKIVTAQVGDGEWRPGQLRAKDD